MTRFALLMAGGLLVAAGPARATELFAGGYAHGVDTPFTEEIFEGGADLQLGIRGDRIEALRFVGRPQPYLLGSLNSKGDTSFAAAGLSWKLGDRIYARPGIGLAIHDAPGRRLEGGRRTDFGSRVLAELELGVGWRASERLSVEASWVHLSHAQIFSNQNPGIDLWGVRLNWRLR